jgi:hypothetical protein
MTLNCHYCKTKTITLPPITLKRMNVKSFNILGICSVCLRTKSKFLTRYEVSQLPNEIMNMACHSTAVEYVEDGKGNMVKIFPLIETIINK